MVSPEWSGAVKARDLGAVPIATEAEARQGNTSVCVGGTVTEVDDFILILTPCGAVYY